MNLSTPNKSEVDKRVAQELKNNQDFIYQTNTQIQILHQKILDLNLKHNQLIANSQSNLKSIMIEFENLQDNALETLSDLNHRMGDLETKMNLLMESINCINAKHSAHENILGIMSSQISCDQKNLDILEHGTISSIEDIQSSIDRMMVYFKEQFIELNKTLAPKELDYDAIHAYIDEKINIFKIDFNGLMKEIYLLKKAQSYSEKKFENIYTLIERLKKDS